MSIARSRWVSIIGLALFVTLGSAVRSEARTITLTFPDLDEILTTFLGSEDLDFTITNASGVTWTDFHLRSEGIGAFRVDDYSGPGTATYLSPIVNPLGVEVSFDIDITGLNVASGGTLTFSQSTFCVGEACGLGGVMGLRPTIDGEPPDDEDPPTNTVPEPSSLALLGAALGMIGVRGKRTK